MMAMSANSPPVFRFAPSPNGELHLGHALSAITGHDWARRVGGRFLVRIEDIDTGRSREAFVGSILDDLDWLGLSWDGPVLHQSQNLANYQAAARQLEAQGLLYPCFASRGEIAQAVAKRAAEGQPVPLDPDGVPIYPGMHRNLGGEEIARRMGEGQRPAMRLDMARAVRIASERAGGRWLSFREQSSEADAVRVTAALPEQWGDVVLVRKDTPTSYHLAVVVDDARQGVTHVTRGKDLYAATDLHRLLQVLLGLPEPIYHHHRLVLGADGAKLAKSIGSPTLKDLRRAGASAADVRHMLGVEIQRRNL